MPTIEVQGLWVAPNTYRVTHLVTGRSLDLIIPGSEGMEPSEVEELIQWQTESSMPELRLGLPPKLNRTQQHDLGGTLMQIKASKQSKRERLHGRFW